jgi:hypothetical protein
MQTDVSTGRWAQLAERGVEPPSVVDVFNAARKIRSDIREGFVVRLKYTASTFSILMQLSALSEWIPVPANTS